jgi:hypothetical protein
MVEWGQLAARLVEAGCPVAPGAQRIDGACEAFCSGSSRLVVRCGRRAARGRQLRRRPRADLVRGPRAAFPVVYGGARDEPAGGPALVADLACVGTRLSLDAARRRLGHRFLGGSGARAWPSHRAGRGARRRRGDYGGVVGEDPDDVAAALDLLVDPLERSSAGSCARGHRMPSKVDFVVKKSPGGPTSSRTLPASTPPRGTST